jgi:hypothetical protein
MKTFIKIVKSLLRFMKNIMFSLLMLLMGIVVMFILGLMWIVDMVPEVNDEETR